MAIVKHFSAVLLVLALSVPAPAQEEPATPAPEPSPEASAATPAAPAGSPSPEASPEGPKKMYIREGDVVAGIGEDGKVKIMKVLKINWQNGNRILHSLAYKEVFNNVAEAQAAYDKKSPRFTLETAHLPIDGEGLSADQNKILGNEDVSKEEMAGYDDYVHEMSN